MKKTKTSKESTIIDGLKSLGVGILSVGTVALICFLLSLMPGDTDDNIFGTLCIVMGLFLLFMIGTAIRDILGDRK